MVRIILLMFTLFVMAGPARAHAFLKSADPAVGATVQTAPTRLLIDYTEAVEPRFSSVEVLDASGVRVDEGPVTVAAGNDRRLVVGLRTLASGTFKVTWHVTSKDTHKTEGSYNFTIRP